MKTRSAIVLAVSAALLVVAAPLALANGGLPGIKAADKATGGGMSAAGLGNLGDTEITEPTRTIMDLPALRADCDAEGRVRLDLPALNLVSRPGMKACGGPVAAAPQKPKPAQRLPKTGTSVGDLLALGMAALGGGGVIVRRLRFQA